MSLVVVAHILSSGLYGLYWIMSRGHCVYFSQGNRASKVFYWVVVFVILAHFTFLFGAPAVWPVDQISFNTVFLSTIVMTALVAIIAARIAKQIGPVDADDTISISVVVALTLLGFTSALYLQYWVNKSK